MTKSVGLKHSAAVIAGLRRSRVEKVTTGKAISEFAQQALKPTGGAPSFEFFAAHFLVGSNLTSGDLDGNIRALAVEFQDHYERGRSAAGETSQ